jgi:lactate permease
VAISAAFLVGLGFRPFQAALLCLIANTAPVAWGAIGTPIRTLAAVTDLDVEALSATAGRILPILSLIVPIWLVRTMVPWRETREVLPALLVIGGAFAAAQFAWSNYVGFELVDIISSAASLAAGMVLLRFWRPRREWRFPEEAGAVEATAGDEPLTFGRVARAWMPFGLLSLAVLVWGVPAVSRSIDVHTSWKPPMPGLHAALDDTVAATADGWPDAVLSEARAAGKTYLPIVVKGSAVTGHAVPVAADFEKVELDIVPIASTGTAIFLAAVISGFLLGVGPRGQAVVFARTVYRLRTAIVTILAMLALGFVTKYAGMDAVLGLAFTRTGPWLYPIFGTLLGWLGVALTGSDTSSNVLFGNLQKITAEKLGLDPILMASANSTGGVMGKMIDAQSIVVAAAATGESGHEGRLLRAVLWHSIALALIVGAIVWVYAHWLPGLVPQPAGVS